MPVLSITEGIRIPEVRSNKSKMEPNPSQNRYQIYSLQMFPAEGSGHREAKSAELAPTVEPISKVGKGEPVQP